MIRGNLVHAGSVVPGGNYRGSLVLKKPIILEAEDSRPSIQGLDGPTLTVTTEHVILRKLILQATATRKPRRATRPTHSSKRKRMDGKTRRGHTKTLRGQVRDD